MLHIIRYIPLPINFAMITEHMVVRTIIYPVNLTQTR